MKLALIGPGNMPLMRLSTCQRWRVGSAVVVPANLTAFKTTDSTVQ